MSVLKKNIVVMVTVTAVIVSIIVVTAVIVAMISVTAYNSKEKTKRHFVPHQ